MRITVKLDKGPVSGEVEQELLSPGALRVVVLFDDGRKMLFSVLERGSIDEEFLAEMNLEHFNVVLNACGEDEIIEVGLIPADFDTSLEGGLYPAVRTGEQQIEKPLLLQ